MSDMNNSSNSNYLRKFSGCWSGEAIFNSSSHCLARLLNNNLLNNNIINLELAREIRLLAKKKNAVILSHIYQPLEIQAVSDFVSDSLELAKKASEINAEIIILCGVSFMAETAKLLNFNKKILLPVLEARCPMADMISIRDIQDLREAHPEAKVLCYVNSTLETKANSDVCCTSSSAVKIAKSLDSEKIIFIPDKGLGSYLQEAFPEKQIICFDGFCPVHYQIRPKDLELAKKLNPEAKVLAHPECPMSVLELADYAGSTSQMYDYIKNSIEKIFIVLTEIGLIERMRADMPDKKIYTVQPSPVCPSMKNITLEILHESLKQETHEIIMQKNETFERAYLAVTKMLELFEK